VAIVTNIGNDTSFPSTVHSIACKLDAPSDNGPQEVARDTAENCCGTAAVTSTRTRQSMSRRSSRIPRWAAQFRLPGSIVGTTKRAAACAGRLSEHKGSDPSVPRIGKVLPAEAEDRRVGSRHSRQPSSAEGKYLTLQCKGRTSGGQPNGTFRLGLWQWDGAAYTAIKARRRLTDDSIVFDLDGITINGSDMITDHQLYWGVFNPIGP